MVNNLNVSRYKGSLPQSDSPNTRAIAGGSLYATEEVLALLAQDSANVVLWTRKCKDDAQKYGFDADDAKELVRLGVLNGRFRGAEWCKQKPYGPWAACDAYSVVRREWVTQTHREMDIEYYIKNKSGFKQFRD